MDYEDIIESVGVEVEAIFEKTKVETHKAIDRSIIFDGYCGDGSVSTNDLEVEDMLRSGDFCNGELRFHTAANNTELLKKQIEKVYDFIIEINESCGLHVHMRFKNKNHYYLMFNRKFIKAFEEAYIDYTKSVDSKNRNKYMNRLSSTYCRLESLKSYYTDTPMNTFIDANNRNLRSDDFSINSEYNQMSLRHEYARYSKGSRYVVLNTQSLAEAQETIEVRIMPYAATPDEFYEEVNFVLRTMHDLIKKYEKEEVTVIKSRYDFVRLPDSVTKTDKRIKQIKKFAVQIKYRNSSYLVSIDKLLRKAKIPVSMNLYDLDKGNGTIYFSNDYPNLIFKSQQERYNDSLGRYYGQMMIIPNNINIKLNSSAKSLKYSFDSMNKTEEEYNFIVDM
jgi:hypothetical protein